VLEELCEPDSCTRSYIYRSVTVFAINEYDDGGRDSGRGQTRRLCWHKISLFGIQEVMNLNGIRKAIKRIT